MGARTWMLVYADSNAQEALRGEPQLDREQTFALAQKLFPREKLERIGDGNLSSTDPPDNELRVGCFPGVSVLAAKEFGIDYPSTLAQRFIEAGGYGKVCLHAMHSVVDWFAFAIWTKGTLVRSLSLSPGSGILEDLGPRLPFEAPYWAGQHPVGDPEEASEYPFPFHPLELGEAALEELFGYHLEGPLDPTLLEPETIPLLRFQRPKSHWWKFW